MNPIIVSEIEDSDDFDEDKEMAEAVMQGEADIAAGRTISAEDFWKEMEEEFDL